MLWPRDPSRDLVSHHIQRHSTKSTNQTYHHLVSDGSPFRYTKPHSSIVGNRLSYIALLRSPPAAIPFVGKRTSRYPSVILLQFRFLLTNIPLLGLDLSSSGSVGIRITPQSLAIDEGLQNRTSLGWRLRWEDVTLLQSVGVRP